LQARLSRWWQALGGGGHPAEPPRASPPEALRLPPRPALPPQAAIVVEARPTEPPRPPEAGEASPEPRAAAPAPRSGARLAVSCFGPFRVALDDQPIDRWESARARTVFKYLITRRDTAALKEQLADMFWPHSEPELAKRSLHQAIYCLRQSFKRVDPQLAIVLFSDDYYQLNPEISVWVDSEEFSGAIAQARARSACGDTDAALRAYALAADLARGEFLAEDRYESWAEELRQRYSAMLSEALRCLSANHYARSDYATAILFSQRLLAQESCDEEAHLTLMRCYMAQGLRHLAVRQYQICVTALKGELGLSPSDDLEAFYQQVLALA
jgi:DNA-binding SARP family transcriptional activator